IASGIDPRQPAERFEKHDVGLGIVPGPGAPAAEPESAKTAAERGVAQTGPGKLVFRVARAPIALSERRLESLEPADLEGEQTRAQPKQKRRSRQFHDHLDLYPKIIISPTLPVVTRRDFARLGGLGALGQAL